MADTTTTTELDPIAARVRDVVVHGSVLACALLDASGRIVAMSRAGARILGGRPQSFEGKTATGIVRDLWRSDAMRLLRNGALNGFSAPTTVRLPDGSLRPVNAWARAIDGPTRRWILLALTPENGSVPLHLPEQMTEALVFGFGDARGRMSMVSQGSKDLLGLDPEHIQDHPVAGFVHADDLPELLLTVSTVVASGRSALRQVRVRHADGSWLPVRVILAAMQGDDQLRLAFCMSRLSDELEVEPDTTARLHELEERLQRIAVEAAGLRDPGPPARQPAPAITAALAELSPRQQEIVRLLAAGHRVPTIAQEIFLSQSTVRNHLSTVFRALGVGSQEELLQLLQGARRRPGGTG